MTPFYQPTLNYLVPASGTTRSVSLTGLFSATPANIDWNHPVRRRQVPSPRRTGVARPAGRYGPRETPDDKTTSCSRASHVLRKRLAFCERFDATVARPPEA